MAYKFAGSIAILNKTEGIDFSLKRIISLTLALLTLVSFIPASVFAANWDNRGFHTDQDEAPKIAYQKAYSYLSGHEYETQDATHPYPVRGVNSPVPVMLNADEYPDGNDNIDYWKATSASPYFAVSYKMMVPNTFDNYLAVSWNDWEKSYNIPDGQVLGGSDQGWYYHGSFNNKYPRMGISLGQAWNSEYDKNVFSMGYTYGFFGFAYQEHTLEPDVVSHYSNPCLVFGPTGHETDKVDSNWIGDDDGATNQYKSDFLAGKRSYPLSAVPVYDRDGSEIYKDFTNQENVIMLVGSYINNKVVLKAYINGYQISKIWGGSDTFSFTDKLDTHTMWEEEWNFTFGGQCGFINQLNGKFAYARFTRSSHALDQNAFNIHHAKVDASRPNDNNNNYFYDQANQWKVDKKNFAASYTIQIDENKTYNYVDGGKDILATSLNCGLVFGRQSREPNNLLGTIDFRFSQTGNGTCKWDSNSKLWFGPDNIAANNATGGLGLNWRKTGISVNGYPGTNLGTTVKGATGTHTLLITGTYDKNSKTAKIKVWLDGEQIQTWFPDHNSKAGTDGKEQTINNFGDGLNYIGWRTNVKGVNAVARFTQWDEDANMDYAAANGTVFDLKTAGPMTGYWDRKVTQNALTWGADETDKFDAVTFTPYNEAWEGDEYPNSNAYQLGMITDPSRSFVVQADIPYNNIKGFYITPEAPTDVTQDGLNIGFSDGKMDDIRKWYNKYYYISLFDVGVNEWTQEGDPAGAHKAQITTWVNTGDGTPHNEYYVRPPESRKGIDYFGGDPLYLHDTVDGDRLPTYTDLNTVIGVRVVYSNKSLSIYVKEGGGANKNTNWIFVYRILDLTDPAYGQIWSGGSPVTNDECNILKNHDGPLYFGLMTKSGENSGNGNTGVTFKNVKVSYGLQSPEEIHTNSKYDNQLMPGVVVMSANAAAQVGSRNNNVAGFAQTRSSQTAGKYDLRVAVEGGELGLYRAENYDAVIRVQMQTEDGSSQKMITSFSHHWAYREFSFYDAEYYFHANGSDNYGLICAVFTNIPETYTDYFVYVDFYERGQTNLTKENVKVSVYLGRGYYDLASNTLHGAGGSPAPAYKNGTEKVDKKLDNGGLSVRNDLYKCFPTYYGR